ncbi:hypothetical protein CLV36_10659 [Laceyella sediminis]|uniref:Uncharacterized protein n=1 Tax=Laceyella sediminis TaxID=573074 RepID=A0ABX5ENN5_9BACL|nr:hypothetical protein [Laceyella sediminis]PRZ14299.1 hypothetical protein CLV36_10659 [Laceyella sediminis]
MKRTNKNEPLTDNRETELPDPLKRLPDSTPTPIEPIPPNLLTPPEEPPPLDLP